MHPHFGNAMCICAVRGNGWSGLCTDSNLAAPHAVNSPNGSRLPCSAIRQSSVKIDSRAAPRPIPMVRSAADGTQEWRYAKRSSLRIRK